MVLRINYTVSLIGICFAWINNDTVHFLLFVLFNEVSVKPLRSLSNMIFLCTYTIGGICGTLLTFLISSYLPFYLMISIGYIISFIVIFYFAQESPSLLLKFGKKEKLIKVINHIKTVNGVDLQVDQEVEQLLSSIKITIQKMLNLKPIY